MSSATRWMKKCVAEKLALAGGAAGLVFCSQTNAQAGIVASTSTPKSPPTTPGVTTWDVDGDGYVDFLLANSQQIFYPYGFRNFASLTEVNGGRFVRAGNIQSLLKLSASDTVGPVMAGRTFNLSARDLTVTDNSAIPGYAAGIGGWSMGDTGFLGFKFTSGSNTYYGWAEMVIDASYVGHGGHGFSITRAYYDDTGAAIKVGDTVSAVPEPSTCALALLAAGGIAAYRARRKVAAA